MGLNCVCGTFFCRPAVRTLLRSPILFIIIATVVQYSIQSKSNRISSIQLHSSHLPSAPAAYFGASADGAPQRKVTAAPRTRHLVEDAVLRRLAGVEPYPAEARSAAREGARQPRPTLLHLEPVELQHMLDRS